MLRQKIRTQVSELIAQQESDLACFSSHSTSAKSIDSTQSSDTIEAALIKVIVEVLETQKNHNEIMTLDELIKANLSFVLQRIDDILGGNSIMGLLKVPLNQSIAPKGEVFSNPHSPETCIYLFSETSKKLAIEMAEKKASQVSLTPPNTAHSRIFRDVLASGKALCIQHSSDMPCRFSADHPQMNSLYLTPIIVGGSPVALFGIANAQMTEQTCKAVQNVLPSIWRVAIIQAAQMHTMQRQIKQEHYIDKLYPQFIGKLLRENNFSTDGLTIDYDDVSVFFCDIKDFTNSSKDMLPSQLITELTSYFGLAAEIAPHYGIELVKTVGDCIIAVGNLAHTSSENNPAAIINFAHEFIDQIQKQSLSINNIAIQIRVGIDYGPISFGLAGFKERKTLDLFGETVNRASRHESSGEPGKVHISLNMASKLAQHHWLELVPRKVELKGFGWVDSYIAPANINYQSATRPTHVRLLPKLSETSSVRERAVSRFGLFKTGAEYEKTTPTRQLLPALRPGIRGGNVVDLSRLQERQLPAKPEHDLICRGASISISPFFHKKGCVASLRERARVVRELELPSAVI